MRRFLRRAAHTILIAVVLHVTVLAGAARSVAAAGGNGELGGTVGIPLVAASSPQVSGILRGVYVPGAPGDPAVLASFESLTGVAPGIIQWYQPWGKDWSGRASSDLDLEDLQRVADRGATPMITWEPWGPTPQGDPARVRRITTGVFDGYIDEWARRLKTYGRPVYMRPFHEMNNPAYSWAYGQNDNSATDLINAWRHVHDRFAHAGASNVRWVWCPNTETDQVSYASLYPGDAYVDWLGVDGYNGGTELAWGGWLGPQELFGRSYRSLVTLSPTKPIMIAETSTVERGGSKAQWIESLFMSLPVSFPNVRAIIWFDADDSARGEADWRVDTSPESLAAYQSVALPL